MRLPRFKFNQAVMNRVPMLLVELLFVIIVCTGYIAFAAAPTTFPRDRNNVPCIGGFDGANTRAIQTDVNGVVQVNNIGGGGGGGGGSFAAPVYGNDATGGAPTKPPVLTAGNSPTGNVTTIVLDANGRVTQDLYAVGGSSLSLGQTTMASSLPVAIANNQGNLNVVVASALPAGGNTIGAVTQASGPWTNNITQIGGSSLALGQTNMAGSIPVVLPSNQASIPVTGSGNFTVTQASAASLKTAADIYDSNGLTIAVGQTTMSASVPVVIASNQSNIPASIAPSTQTSVTTQTTISVTNSATQLLAANAARHGFAITNTGAVDIYIGFNNSVVSGAIAQANGGVVVKANGSAFNGSLVSGWTGTIYAITASSTSVVGVLEW